MSNRGRKTGTGRDSGQGAETQVSDETVAVSDETVVVFAGSAVSDETAAVADSTAVTDNTEVSDETVVVFAGSAVADDTVTSDEIAVSDETVAVSDDTVAVSDETVAVSDETVVVSDETVVVSDDTVVVSDDTVAVSHKDSGRGGAHADGDATVATPRDPAPPVPEPSSRDLPPDLAQRMFKSPLSAKYRVQQAPTAPAEHALPRLGVSPVVPVLSSTRSGRTVTESAGVDLSAALGQVPGFLPPPPAAQRVGLRSQQRANRAFGRIVVMGFAASVLLAGFGLWGIKILAFG